MVEGKRTKENNSLRGAMAKELDCIHILGRAGGVIVV